MKEIYSNITVGADPEFFYYQPENGFGHSLNGKLGGTKSKPVKVPGLAGASDIYSSYQEDNLAAEINTCPAKTRTAFVQSIQSLIKVVDNNVQNSFKDMNIKISRKSGITFQPSVSRTPQALAFGCEPDFNAWTGQKNPKPELTDDNVDKRYAGGHVHVGYAHSTAEKNINLVKALDVALGVPSRFLVADLATELERRKMYGMAGAFRPKPYGVEYRTLSNFWIWDLRKIEWVWNQVHRAIAWLNDGNKVDDDDMKAIQNLINPDSYNEEDLFEIASKYSGLILQ